MVLKLITNDNYNVMTMRVQCTGLGTGIIQVVYDISLLEPF